MLRRRPSFTYKVVYDFRQKFGDMLTGDEILEVYNFWQEYLKHGAGYEYNEDNDDNDDDYDPLPPHEILTPDQIKRVEDITNCRKLLANYSKQLRDFVPRETIVEHLEEEKSTLRTLQDTKV